MHRKKRSRTMYSADTDDDDNITLVHEEQTTFLDTRPKKKISFSRTTHNNLSLLVKAADIELSNLRNFSASDDLDVDDFFSSTVDEVIPDGLDKPGTSNIEDQQDVESSESESDEEELLEEDVSPIRSRSKPLQDFKELRTEFMRQFIRRYHPSSVSGICKVCGTEGAALLCLDCFLFESRCQDCLLKEHRHLPLHRIQYFDGGAWQKTSLRELGFVVYLGHNGAPCPATSETKRIILIDFNGIQEIDVSFCSCEGLIGEDATECSQLINHGWFPATTEHPGTVATFGVLDAFEALLGEGKLSGYHFYRSIIRLKDGAGYETVPRRYEEFMRMTREYQHIKMLLRAGKTSDLDGPLAVADGELAIQCPACPHPGQNIPPDWDRRVDSWIYTLYIMVDANFRLKLKKKKIIDDHDLEDGGSYFVRGQPYMEHVGKCVEEKEMKYCDSGLRAVDHANLKGGQGYNASGVVGVQCRHMMIRANGVGDLQKGEKYANVDFVVLSSLRNLEIKRVVMSYDIACQYSRNFTKRMSKFNNDLQLDLSKLDLGFVIPQFHIAGHGDSCRTRYNLRFREHVGRTDGENIERGWAALNPLSMVSKEMGSGGRHDYLNWHIGDFNYQQIVSFSPLFARKLAEAIVESVKHSQILTDFRQNFPKNVVKDIEEAIRKWDKDPHGSPDPYSEGISKGKLLPKTRQKLTESEIRQETFSFHSNGTSEAQWLVMGMDLEDKQWESKRSYKGTVKEKAKFASTADYDKNAQTVRKICAWKSEQVIHMPRITRLPMWTMPEQEKGFLRCWKYKLLLPSSLSAQHRQFACSDGLVEKESELRLAQMHDSLMEIRHLIQRVWWLRKKKRKHVSGAGQKLNTKSNCAIDVVVQQRDNEVSRYRRARNALSSLQPDGAWETTFKVLRDEDVRHFEDDEGKGEGRRTPSWLWTVKGATMYRYEEDAIAYEGLRVEYAKARARAFRWFEEVQLIKEEMRRVISYFNFKIDWWLEKNGRLLRQKDDEILGAIVYGNRQIIILQKLGEKFLQLWKPHCEEGELPGIRSVSVTVVKGVKLPRFNYDP